MAATAYHEIKPSLRQFYLEDQRPWIVGFSGGNQVARATRLRASATRRHNSERLLASGGERMEKLIESRQPLLFYQDPASGKCDVRHVNQIMTKEKRYGS